VGVALGVVSGAELFEVRLDHGDLSIDLTDCTELITAQT
jgi:hypothetical protein